MKMRLGCGLGLLVVVLEEVRQGHVLAHAAREGLDERLFVAHRDDREDLLVGYKMAETPLLPGVVSRSR